MKQKGVANDGFAVWFSGNNSKMDLHINEWISPPTDFYIEFGIRIYEPNGVNFVNLFVPYHLEEKDVVDLSNTFCQDVARGIFNASCTVTQFGDFPLTKIIYEQRQEYMIKISKFLKLRTTKPEDGVLPRSGTIISFSIAELIKQLEEKNFVLDNNAYIRFRIPHKTINSLFSSPIDHWLQAKSLLDSPVIQLQYDYSLKVNEIRMLPSEVRTDSYFRSQKIEKTFLALTIPDSYDIDNETYKIRILERDLLGLYLPSGFRNSKVYMVYQWWKTQEKGKNYSFDVRIRNDIVNKKSLILYAFFVVVLSAIGSALWSLISSTLMCIS